MLDNVNKTVGQVESDLELEFEDVFEVYVSWVM